MLRRLLVINVKHFSSMSNAGALKNSGNSKSIKSEKEEIQIPGSIQAIRDGVVKISVQAKPNAKTSAITETNNEYIGVAIAAPPRDGEANEELISFMSQVLNIKKQHIQLDKGSKSRLKTLLVDSLTAEEVYNKITESSK